ncbi:nucleoredoxin [Crotalus adamanteus]|uniref:Nucleoredoxin n=1 Tax=Crotalus adamanteus TaxID=8729 RepID=A0AAW1CDB0_CROAD
MAALAELLGEALAAPDGSAVATASLPARGVSLVGLFFGYCGGGPCAQVAANLAAFYARFQPGGPEGAAAAAAGGAAAAAPSRPPPQRLEIVFVSAEQEQPRWQEATRAMPWPALPFADKRRKVRAGTGRGRPGRGWGLEGGQLERGASWTGRGRPGRGWGLEGGAAGGGAWRPPPPGLAGEAPSPS